MAAVLVPPASWKALHDRARQRLAAAGIRESAREAYLIVAAGGGPEPLRLIARAAEAPPPAITAGVLELAERRARHEPMAYILGCREFYGRSFRVGPGALVPRPETELLVEKILADHARAPFRFGLDLCAGTGCVAITLAATARIELAMLDKSQAALAYARLNSQALLKQELAFHTCDLLEDPLPEPRYDLLVMNPPYLSAAELAAAPELGAEPREALLGGERTGLEFTAKVLERLYPWAAPGTRFYIELGWRHREWLGDRSHWNGWRLRGWIPDLAGIARVLVLYRE